MYIICMHACVYIPNWNFFQIYAASLFQFRVVGFLDAPPLSLYTLLMKAKLFYLCVSVVNMCLSDCMQPDIYYISDAVHNISTEG